jgi:hypothetical protein
MCWNSRFDIGGVEDGGWQVGEALFELGSRLLRSFACCSSRKPIFCSSFEETKLQDKQRARGDQFPCWMSTQQAAPKPSLTGVRIKARKGAVKAQAKHEPEGKPSGPESKPSGGSVVASAVLESHESGRYAPILQLKFICTTGCEGRNRILARPFTCMLATRRRSCISVGAYCSPFRIYNFKTMLCRIMLQFVPGYARPLGRVLLSFFRLDFTISLHDYPMLTIALLLTISLNSLPRSTLQAP